MELKWDETGKRLFETGIEKTVLYLLNEEGKYTPGVAWNGITAVNENPSGADDNPFYADGIKYANLKSKEEYGATIEAFTFPDEFAACDGSASVAPGVSIGQQDRKVFGLCYKTKIGNDVKGTDFGYKLHLIWGAQASPSDKDHQTESDNPDLVTMSWEISTTPVNVNGFKPTASMEIDSTKVASAKLTLLENKLYGTADAEPILLLPDEIIDLITKDEIAG